MQILNDQGLDASGFAQEETRASLQRWTHGLVNRIVMGLDILAIVSATFAFWAASPSADRQFTWLQAGAIAIITLSGFHVVMDRLHGYRVERYSKMRCSLTDVGIALAGSSVPAAVIILAFLPEVTSDSRWLFGWTGSIFLGLTLERYAARLLVRITHRRALLRRRVIVVGSGPEAARIIHRLRDPQLTADYQIVGLIDPVTMTISYGEGTTSDFTSPPLELTEYAQNYAIDLVIIALPWERAGEIVAITRRLQWIAADVVVPFELGGLNPLLTSRMAFSDAPLLHLMQRPFKGSQGFIKMLEDYAVAAISLIVASPFMMAAAVAIRLEGSGPILFKQPRVGFNSKPFMIYKFRTMTADPTDDGSKGTQRENQRITRVGALLRRTSIDELPQLFNVLRGEMSIVGPRPHVSNMLVGAGVYSDVVQQYAARHRIKPGITGWAQINGMRGGIDSVEKAMRGAELDLFYIANWSPRFDIEIMARTIASGLIGRNVF